LDENCDGSVDEDNPGGGGDCGSDLGICVSGIEECSDGELVCVGSIGPSDELCNGLDDDCDGTEDDGFECAQGELDLSCTHTECGTPGNRTCDETCTAWTSCSAPEVCNYCDDNWFAGLSDDRPLATETYDWPNSHGICNGLYDQLGDAWCRFSADRAVLADAARERGGHRLRSEFTLGYGGIVVTARIWVQRGTSSCPADGWALVVTDEEGLDTLGEGGGNLGINHSWRGYAAEWRFYNESFTCPGEFIDEIDELMLRPLTGDGRVSPYTDNWLNVGDSLNSDTDGEILQTISMTIIPDWPGDSTNTMRVDATGIAPCEGAGCPVQFAPGETLRVGIVASTGGADAVIGFDESGFRAPDVSITGLCP